MSLFYLDTEHSNGNFYLGDIFELALISEKSGNAFHTLIKIPTQLDNYLKFMCCITDQKIRKEGIKFEQAFDDMIDFVDIEADGKKVILAAHSGFLADFPLLLINCIKNRCDIHKMNEYDFVDTLQILQKDTDIKTTHNTGFSLKSLAEKVLGDRMLALHSAYNDAVNLKNIFSDDPYKDILMRNLTNTYDLQTIHQHVNSKMPITIDDLYTHGANVSSPDRLSLLLSKHVREKTALNKSNVNKIASYYYCFAPVVV